jgi:DNA-binding MarR family transcriptional regulator
MNTSKKLSSTIYTYVVELYKGKGKSLGEIASEARVFESDMSAWIDMIEAREGLIR